MARSVAIDNGTERWSHGSSRTFEITMPDEVTAFDASEREIKISKQELDEMWLLAKLARGNADYLAGRTCTLEELDASLTALGKRIEAEKLANGKKI